MIWLGLLAAIMAGDAPRSAYACGDDQVRELRIADGAATETWRWSAAAATDLPAEYRRELLSHIDDCKPVEDGRAILVTASTGGAVLIDRATGRVRFRAKVPMAHSAALLPGGLIAIALSIHDKGDRLELYDSRRSERPLQRLPLPSGHGAVWDDARGRLFALSHDLVQGYAVEATAHGPRLVERGRWTLPGARDGHDLSPDAERGYYVTTEDGAWRFDPDDGSFRAFAPLNPRRQVKSVSAMGDRLAWVQAEERWWAHGFTVAAGDGSAGRRIEVADMHLYKVRWVR